MSELSQLNLSAIIYGGLTALCLGLIYQQRFTLQKMLDNLLKRKNTPVAVEINMLDLQTLKTTQAILDKPQNWTQNAFEHCVENDPATLYGALAIAAKKTTGSYNLDTGYCQLLLQAICDHYPDRCGKKNSPFDFDNSLLLAFNNHALTKHDEVKLLIEKAISMTEQRVRNASTAQL